MYKLKLNYLFISLNKKCTGKCLYNLSVNARTETSNMFLQIRCKINIMQRRQKMQKLHADVTLRCGTIP